MPSAGQSKPAPDSSWLDADDLADQLIGDKSSTLWLGRFSTAAIMAKFRKSGVLAALESQGLRDIHAVIEPLEPFLQALRFYTGARRPERLLAEFRLRETQLAKPACAFHDFPKPEVRVLAIDWLLMQNPLASFTPARPPLPGQLHPGLGLSRRILKSLMALATYLNLEGLTNFPDHFHNAYLYQRYFCFCEPARAGRFRALVRDLRDLPLAKQSWAVELGCVRSLTRSQTLRWSPALLLLPLSSETKAWFDRPSYTQEVDRAAERERFVVDHAKLDRLYPASATS